MAAPKRSIVTGFLLLVLSLLGAALFRRRGGGRHARADLYYADGSMVSLVAGSPEGQSLLAVARDLLREVRG
jgi:hypothetical protein